MLISVPSWAKIVFYRLNLLKDVFRQPYAMHVLYLPCTQLSLMHKCLVHSEGKIQKPAVTPRELNLGLLASTTSSELQPPENHQASQSSMSTAKGQLNSCTPTRQGLW